MRIEVEGLDELRARLGKGALLINREVRPALAQAATEIRADARGRAVGNILPNSVQMRALPGGVGHIVGSVAKTAPSIEAGRPRGQMPPAKLITAWMGRSGIVSEGAALAGAVQSLKTRKVLTRGRKSARSQNIMRAQRDLAWKIAMAIKEVGTKPLPFIRPAGEAKAGRVQQLVQEAVGRALRAIAHG